MPCSFQIFHRPGCPYCHRALDKLRNLGRQLEEWNIVEDDGAYEEMRRRMPGWSAIPVPQIWAIDLNTKERERIGGADDLDVWLVKNREHF